MRIWDNHVHFPRNWQAEDPNAGAGDLVDHLAERLREVTVVKAAVFSGGNFGPTHEQCMEHLQRHADLFVPVAMVDPEVTSGDRVAELHEMGYKGLKMIGPKRAYDEPDYYPIYERAQELRMPIVFHLGVIGGAVDLMITHPRRDAQAADRLRQMKARRGPGGRDVSAMRMRPFHLDTIANNFPDLRIVGAHMGGTGNYDEAASVVRWRLNVLLDLSGGEVIERHAVERGLIGREISVDKLVWGSDCPADEVHEHVERLEKILDDLALDEDARDRIWYRNAAELYGYEEERWAGE